MSEPSKYRVYFVNFGYYSANEATNEVDAKTIAARAGYQCHIERDGDIVLSYAPGAGFRPWYPDRPSSRDVK